MSAIGARARPSDPERADDLGGSPGQDDSARVADSATLPDPPPLADPSAIADPPPLADPSAIAFDLYGTILDLGSLLPLCREVFPEASPDELLALWRQKQLEYTWLRSLMDRYADFWVVTGDALEHVCRRLGLGLSPSARTRLMEGWLSLQPYGDVHQGLAKMAPRPLAVLSNGSPEMLEEVLRRSNVRSRFSHVLSVDEVRTYKPDPAVYRLAERHLSASRDQILFVSGNSWDAAGASSFGLRVAWVNRLGQAPEGLPGGPDVVVSDLVALGERLSARAS